MLFVLSHFSCEATSVMVPDPARRDVMVFPSWEKAAAVAVSASVVALALGGVELLILVGNTCLDSGLALQPV